MEANKEPALPADACNDETRLRQWLTDKVAELLQLKSSDIDPAKPLGEYGLDSMAAVTLTGELEDMLAVEISPSLPYEHPTINALAKELTHGRKSTR